MKWTEIPEAMQRQFHQDNVTELAIPDWNLASEAIKAGRVEEALNLFESLSAGNKRMHDIMVSFVEELVTHIASFGEKEVMKILRQIFYPRAEGFLSATPGAEEALQKITQSHREHQSDFTVKEEPDRYVVTHDPCGSGGRLRRSRSVGTTKKAYPWSWGKAGVPYYCCHCCILWEVISIELRGYPVRITETGDKPEDPCIHFFYKKPELIPAEYFTRVGMEKDMARINNG